MNKQIIICALFLSFFLVSCWSNPQYETAKGENIIPKDTLELMIYDIHLADAIITAKIMKTNNNTAVDSLVYSSIFVKYNYSRNDFEQTLLYFSHNHLDTLNAMYDRVINKFHIAEGEIYK